MTRYFRVGGPDGAVYPENNTVAFERGTPVAVIDPEGREEVERLADALIEAMCKSDFGWDKSRAYEVRSHMREALTAYANPKPPKPDEPTNRYAVVVDSAGVEWLRDRNGIWCHVRQEDPGALTRWTSSSWARIDAVRVLSEGVAS